MRQYFLNRGVLLKPRRLLRNFRKLRVLGQGYRREFFGGARSNPA